MVILVHFYWSICLDKYGNNEVDVKMHLFREAELVPSRAILRTGNEQQYNRLSKMGSNCPLYIFVCAVEQCSFGGRGNIKIHEAHLHYNCLRWFFWINKSSTNIRSCLVSTHSPKDIWKLESTFWKLGMGNSPFAFHTSSWFH